MRHETSKLGIQGVLLIVASFGASCRNAPPAAASTDDIRADFPAYCRATMECEGDNASAIHHVCMMAPIPFGMMLCEGNNARSVNACVAATETFRNEAVSYGCDGEFATLFRCLHTRSTCARNEFDQSPCRTEIRAMTSCVNAASGTRAAVATHATASNSCAALSTACASCGSAALGEQCRRVTSTGDDGTCAQALTVVQQTCRSPAS